MLCSFQPELAIAQVLQTHLAEVSPAREQEGGLQPSSPGRDRDQEKELTVLELFFEYQGEKNLTKTVGGPKAQYGSIWIHPTDIWERSIYEHFCYHLGVECVCAFVCVYNSPVPWDSRGFQLGRQQHNDWMSGVKTLGSSLAMPFIRLVQKQLQFLPLLSMAKPQLPVHQPNTSLSWDLWQYIKLSKPVCLEKQGCRQTKTHLILCVVKEMK